MTPTDTARCLALIAGAYDTTPTPEAVEVWHTLLADLEPAVVLEATKRLCLRDSPFPPRPGEVHAEALRLSGDTPPDLEAALGYYMAGDWDVHPLVARAAKAVYWDRHNAPDKATWDFRQQYARALDGEANPGRSGEPGKLEQADFAGALPRHLRALPEAPS